ncbi:MAG TPA: hydantoinase/oxoprolinase family protein [Solirubrobacteraceae bacterium]|nr:hydantoinase/oxoprolinase family protein [Solirubrobacteraceae bacterium]
MITRRGGLTYAAAVLLGVDVGGTFTDAVLVGEDGAIHTAKVPTTPSQQARGVLAAVREVLSRAGAKAGAVTRFAHGMTVATNALLEGDTARTALVTTAGFTDVIELGRQSRPHLYRLWDAPPLPLVPAELRFGTRERTGPDGVLVPLAEEDARAVVDELAAAAPEAVAVSLLHSYADPSHERLLGELIEARLPNAHVSLSSDLVGTFREFERTATTVLDAALSPRLRGYLGELGREALALGVCEPQIMQSSGGLTHLGRAGAHAALTALSGPAGGVGGAQLVAELAGEADVLCFDMGGTSCDVCVLAEGQVPETAERTVAGRPLSLPSLDIHTVGAGGGSIAWRDGGGALRVGPRSAGADPGPACYGRGRDLPTVTDANLLLGRLLGDAPLAGGVALDRAAARRAVGALAHELHLTELACAEGIVRVAEAEMLGALRVMTVQRGIDPRRLALMPFGGAGPLHACALAEGLGIERVLCPQASGVLSALGLAAAPPRCDSARTVMLAGASLGEERLGTARAALLSEALADLRGPAERARVRYELRYRGQSFELPVDEDLPAPVGVPAPGAKVPGADATALASRFHDAHEARYGYRDEEADVELVTMRVSVWGSSPVLAPRAAATAQRAGPQRTALVIGGEPVEATLLLGEPEAGQAVRGPALVALPAATLLVRPGWSGSVDAHGTIALTRSGVE